MQVSPLNFTNVAASTVQLALSLSRAPHTHISISMSCTNYDKTKICATKTKAVSEQSALSCIGSTGYQSYYLEKLSKQRHMFLLLWSRFLPTFNFLFCPLILPTRNQCVIVLLFCNISRCLPNPSMPRANEQ